MFNTCREETCDWMLSMVNEQPEELGLNWSVSLKLLEIK